MLKTLESPRTARRSNQSILKEINPEYSLEGLMLKLKLQYFGHLMRRADSFEKTVMLVKIEERRRGWQRINWLNRITDSMDMCLSSLWDMVKDREAWSGDIHGVTKSQKKTKDWTSQLQNPWFNQLIVQPLCWLNWLVAFKSVLQIKWRVRESKFQVRIWFEFFWVKSYSLVLKHQCAPIFYFPCGCSFFFVLFFFWSLSHLLVK